MSLSAMGAENNRGCLFTGGQTLRYLNNRYIEGTQPPIEVDDFTAEGMNTRDVVFDGIRAQGTDAPYSPLISVDASCINITVRDQTGFNVTSLMSISGQDGAQIELGDNKVWHQKLRALHFNSVAEVSLADDAATSVEFDTAGTRGIMIISGSVGAGGAAVYHFRVGTSLTSAVLSSAGPTVTATTGALTGTTGNDTELTLSVHTDNKLYIENRTGGTRGYTITFLSVNGGQLVV